MNNHNYLSTSRYYHYNPHRYEFTDSSYLTVLVEYEFLCTRSCTKMIKFKRQGTYNQQFNGSINYLQAPIFTASSYSSIIYQILIANNYLCLHLLHIIQLSSSTSSMNNLFTATFIAIVIAILANAPSSSALLFSPLLLKTNAWGIVGRNSSKTIKMPIQRISNADSASSIIYADFSHDDDLMRCRHRVLSDVYEKSLNRGFEGQ